jgi:hypothetical protein
MCIYLFINGKNFSVATLSAAAFNVMTIISVHELAKTTFTCTKWFNIIIIL